MLQPARGLGLRLAVAIDLTALLGDLGEVADPASGDGLRGARLDTSARFEVPE